MLKFLLTFLTENLFNNNCSVQFYVLKQNFCWNFRLDNVRRSKAEVLNEQKRDLDLTMSRLRQVFIIFVKLNFFCENQAKNVLPTWVFFIFRLWGLDRKNSTKESEVLKPYRLQIQQYLQSVRFQNCSLSWYQTVETNVKCFSLMA